TRLFRNGGGSGSCGARRAAVRWDLLLGSLARTREPGVDVPQGTRRRRLLAGERLVLATEAFDAFRPDDLDRREEAEVDVHRLKAARAALVGQVPSGDVADQGAERGGRRGQDDIRPHALRGGEPAGKES